MYNQEGTAENQNHDVDDHHYQSQEQLLERLADFSFRHHQDKLRIQMLEQTIVKQQYRIDVLENTVQSIVKKDQGALRNVNIFDPLVKDSILPSTTSTSANTNNNEQQTALVAASISSSNGNDDDNNNNNNNNPLPPPRRNASHNPRHRSLSVVTTEADKTQIDQAVLVRRNEALQEDMHKHFVKSSHSEKSHRNREKELENEIEALKARLVQAEGERHSLSGRVADMVLTQRAATNLQNLMSKVQSQRATRNSCLLRIEATERERMASHDDLSYTYRHDPSLVNAPRGKVVVVFTDIFGFSSISNESSEHQDFAKFVTKQYLEIVRECARLTKGYTYSSHVYETHRPANNSEIIMHCFSNAIDAMLFASEVQLRMVKQSWPETMLTDPRFEVVRYVGSSSSNEQPEQPISSPSSSSKPLIFCGPRVRSGLHVAELSTEFDEASCSMKYRGDGITIAAMAAARARPGEILITSDFWQKMKEEIGPVHPEDQQAMNQVVARAADRLTHSGSQHQQAIGSQHPAFSRPAILQDFFTLWRGDGEPIGGAESVKRNDNNNNNDDDDMIIRLLSVVPPPLHDGRRAWWKSQQFCQTLEEMCKKYPESASKLKDHLIWTKSLGISIGATTRLAVCGSKTQKNHLTLLEKRKLRKNWTPLEEADYEIHRLRNDMQKQFFLSTMARKSLEGYERARMWEHDFYERAAEKPPEGTIGLAFVRIHQQDKITNEVNADVMTEAVRNYHSQIRQCCRRNRGYLVKRDGELMMVAFPSLVFMLDFASQLHLNMLSQVQWNQEFDQHQATSSEYPDDDLTKRPILRGLRCCVAMNLVQPVCERDPVTLKMEYFGPSVQILAQVILHARGGESLIGEDGFQAARKAGLLGDKSHFAVVPRGLKSIPGVRRPEMTYAILPKQLNARFNFWYRADQDEAAGITWKPRDTAGSSSLPNSGGSPSRQRGGDRNTGGTGVAAGGRRGINSARTGSARNAGPQPPGASSSSRNRPSPDRARTASGNTSRNNNTTNPRFKNLRGGKNNNAGDKDGKNNNNDDASRDLTGDMHVVASVPNDTAHLVSRVGKLLTHYNDAGDVNIGVEQAGALRSVRKLRHEKHKLEQAYAAAETSMMMLHDESGLVADVPYLGRAAVVLLDAPGLEKLGSQVGDAIKQKAFIMYRQVINDKCDLYDGYRVKHNGEDGFMVVFRNVAVALQFCVEVQSALLHCPWPSDLSKYDPTLRVREAKQREKSHQHQQQDQSNKNVTKSDSGTFAPAGGEDEDASAPASSGALTTTSRKQQQNKKDAGPLAFPATQQQLLFHGIRCRAGVALGDVHTQFDPFTRRTDYSSGPVAFMAYRTCSAAFPGEICISADAMKELYKADLNVGGSLLHSVKIFPKQNLHTNVDDGIPTVSGDAARLFSVLPNHLAGRASKFPQSNAGMKRIGSKKNKTGDGGSGGSGDGGGKDIVFFRRRLTLDEVLALTRELWWRQVGHMTTPIVIQKLRRNRNAVPKIVEALEQPPQPHQLVLFNQFLQQQQQTLGSNINGATSPLASPAHLQAHYLQQMLLGGLSPSSPFSLPHQGDTASISMNNNNTILSSTSNTNTTSSPVLVGTSVGSSQQQQHQLGMSSPGSVSSAQPQQQNTTTSSRLQAFNQNVASASRQPFSTSGLVQNNNNNKDNPATATTNMSSQASSLNHPSNQQHNNSINNNLYNNSMNTVSQYGNEGSGTISQQGSAMYTNLMVNTSSFNQPMPVNNNNNNNQNQNQQQLLLNSNINFGDTFTGMLLDNAVLMGGGDQQQQQQQQQPQTTGKTTKQGNKNTASPSQHHHNLQQHQHQHQHQPHESTIHNNQHLAPQHYATTSAANSLPPVNVAPDFEAQIVSFEDMCRNAVMRVEKVAEILHSNANPLDGTLSPQKLAVEMEHLLIFAKTLFSAFMRSGILKTRNLVAPVAALAEPVEHSYLMLMREPFSFVQNPLQRMVQDARNKRSNISCVNCGLSLTDYPFCPKSGARHDRTTRFFGYRKNGEPVVPTPNEVRLLLDDFAAVDDDFDGRITLPQLQTMLAWNGEFIDEVTFSAITASSPEAKAGVATADDLLTARPVDLLRALHPTLREAELVAIIDEARAGTPSEDRSVEDDDELISDVDSNENNSRQLSPTQPDLTLMMSRKATVGPNSASPPVMLPESTINNTTIPDAGTATVRGSRVHTPTSTLAATGEHRTFDNNNDDEDDDEDENHENTNQVDQQSTSRGNEEQQNTSSNSNGNNNDNPTAEAALNMFEATLRGMDHHHHDDATTTHENSRRNSETTNSNNITDSSTTHQKHKQQTPVVVASSSSSNQQQPEQKNATTESEENTVTGESFGSQSHASLSVGNIHDRRASPLLPIVAPPSDIEAQMVENGSIAAGAAGMSSPQQHLNAMMSPTSLIRSQQQQQTTNNNINSNNNTNTNNGTVTNSNASLAVSMSGSARPHSKDQSGLVSPPELTLTTR